MKCIICGRESGKYQYCKDCYSQQKQKVNDTSQVVNESAEFIYEKKQKLITENERVYYEALKKAVPAGFYVFPQVNLATFVYKTDGSHFHNELFRNIDFLITDENYCPRIVVEINDQTHMNSNRIERDKKIIDILEEAGVPLMRLWTSYGVNQTYIENQIQKLLNEIPVRVHHAPTPEADKVSVPIKKPKEGCYIATCVYGSYDCPEVMVLRQYRDGYLAKTWCGRQFIKVYYAVSPTLVKWFGNKEWFSRLWKPILDEKVKHLIQENG